MSASIEQAAGGKSGAPIPPHRPSAREEEIVAFLRAWPHPYGPTIRELADGIGLASTSSVPYWLVRLREKGIVAYEDGKARTLRLAS